jgi:AraC family transcriptional activator of mtrCDE
VHAGNDNFNMVRSGTATQLAGLVSLMRGEATADRLGGRAMLNALSTAMFALVLRLASEADSAPVGLLALAGHPRLAPALAVLFNEPARQWSLPELARVSNMSRATLARQFQNGDDAGPVGENAGAIGRRPLRNTRRSSSKATQ